MNIAERISANLGIALNQVLAHINEARDSFELLSPGPVKISDLHGLQEIARRSHEYSSPGTKEKHVAMQEWLVYSMQAMIAAKQDYEIIRTAQLSPQGSVGIAWAIRKLKLIYIQKMAEMDILAT